MTLPANIRVNTGAPFPSTVKGSGPVTISKQNGIWTVGFQYANIAGIAAGTNPTTLLVLLYNTVTKTFQTATVQQLLALAANNPTNISVANSPYVPLVTDNIIFVDASGGPVEIDLAAANTRSGSPLTIKDINGHANANNITIKPNGLETIDGHTNGAPLKINANYGGFRLNPTSNSYVIMP